MKKTTDLKNKFSRKIHRTGLQIKKHSPEILVVFGVAGITASTVMACRATTKLNGILDEAKNNLDTIKNAMNNEVLNVEQEDGTIVNEYTEQDQKRDLTLTYVQTGIKIAKLYAPAVAVGTLSIGFMLKSNNILRKRNIALAAAYKVVDSSYKEYRSRVVERFGEGLDRELRYNIKAKEIEETIVDENGTEQTVTKTVEVIDTHKLSEYARFFDATCPDYTKSPEHNKSWLLLQQSHANKKLQTQGYLFLNDVYEMLGMAKSQAGQVVGWVYDKDREDEDADNYIDFRIGDYYHNARFMNQYESVAVIDPNVDGNILDMIGWER